MSSSEGMFLRLLTPEPCYIYLHKMDYDMLQSLLVNQVSRFDWLLTETQVRHCNTTGFLRIIIKVSLCIHICMVTDNLDRVLVSTYSTISSKSQNLQFVVPSGVVTSGAPTSSDRCVTSSSIPIVNLFLSTLLNTATI